jgi:LAO/AO transport system kinase
MAIQQTPQFESENPRSLARAISLLENEGQGYQALLHGLSPSRSAGVVGITGPPGAGKSTLTDGLIGEWIKHDKKVAVLCVDPSSPFNMGALLGDRIRMSEWYTHPKVFIRSLATRGSLGGLSPKIIEITDLLRSAGFDRILIETVGVGQSEIEIAGLADCTVVVIVPESGDEVQTMKAGLMEIADVFVINKSDRPDADVFEKNLRHMLSPTFRAQLDVEIPVLKTVATAKKGLGPLLEAIEKKLASHLQSDRYVTLLTDKVWQLLAQKKMRPFDKNRLEQEIRTAMLDASFNLYAFVEQHA